MADCAGEYGAKWRLGWRFATRGAVLGRAVRSSQVAGEPSRNTRWYVNLLGGRKSVVTELRREAGLFRLWHRTIGLVAKACLVYLWICRLTRRRNRWL